MSGPVSFIHPTAHVDDSAQIGAGSRIWVNAQLRESVCVGGGCVVGKDVYIDHGVIVGDRCKIQNSALIYSGVTLGDDVFVGPGVTFTNDRVPRAFSEDWEIVPTRVENGASIGANATILCGVTIGEFALVAAGSVVIHDVADYTLVAGHPASPVARVDRSGLRVTGSELVSDR